MSCGVNRLNHQLLLCFPLPVQTQKKKGIPLFFAFAQVFLGPDVKKEQAGLSEGKQQLINWLWIQSCVVSIDPCKRAQKIAFSRPYVAHSPASPGQS